MSSTRCRRRGLATDFTTGGKLARTLLIPEMSYAGASEAKPSTIALIKRRRVVAE